jgi:hypothetical protein
MKIIGANMLIAWAFICSISAINCEDEAMIKAVVGKGNTPISCLTDGQEGAANSGIFAEDGERLIIRCKRS